MSFMGRRFPWDLANASRTGKWRSIARVFATETTKTPLQKSWWRFRIGRQMTLWCLDPMSSGCNSGELTTIVGQL
jgi:hypothetical protein